MFWKKKKKSRVDAELQILYGTRTGNSQLVAKQAQHYYTKNGVSAECTNIYKFEPDRLEKTKNLLVVISTYEEGESPPQAKKFFIELMKNNDLDLSRLNYSICALGDSFYEQFCFAGKELDKRFAELGAKTFYPRTDCDTEFSNKAIDWIKQSYKAYKEANNSESQPKISDEEIDLSNDQKYYDAQLVDKIRLSGDSNPDEIFHLTFKVNESGLDFQPGDSIEIIPSNPESLVDKIIEKLPPSKNGFDLKSFLLNEAEITSLQQSTLEKYQPLTNAPEFNKLLSNSESRKVYVKQANVLDLLSDYPSSITVNQLQRLLPKIQSRVYSIASSPHFKPSYLDLTVKTIRYDFNQHLHEGAASVFINENIAKGKEIKFALEKNPCFLLPEASKTPVIMIAVGTGIAPFRAFLQETEASNRRGKLWLIWGMRFSDDYALYHSEFKEQLNLGILKKLDVVYSRNQDTGKYVQDVIKDNNDQLLDWLHKGAHIYVCGSIQMGNAVHKELDRVLQQNHIGSVENLEASERYHVDVY